MSISNWSLSFSSSPRTWLNFFMKSWAFPASGRFSVNRKCHFEEKVCIWRGDGVCSSYSLAIVISFPSIAVLLASDWQQEESGRGKCQLYWCWMLRVTHVAGLEIVSICYLTTGSLWRSSNSFTRPLNMFWHFHISFRALDQTKIKQLSEIRLAACGHT